MDRLVRQIMKISTNTLTGKPIDYTIAKCVGKSYVTKDTDYAPDGRIYQPGTSQPLGPNYSTDWAQGGPIIERELIHLAYSTAIYGLPAGWTASKNGKQVDGPTTLIAAMRCFIASKLGDEVDVPEELL